MILSDLQILKAMEEGSIVIDPFDRSRLGSNSYDVTLGNKLVMYRLGSSPHAPLDPKIDNPTCSMSIPEDGVVLKPRQLYLASTVEYTETHEHVPFLDGKSSVGRLGIFVHATAGRGDVGFCNHWTLELSVVEPVIVYPGMPIGQIIFFETGSVEVPYNKKSTAKYNGRNPHPMPSQMWRNFMKGGSNE